MTLPDANRRPARPVYVAGSGTFLPGDPIAHADIGRVLGPIPGASPAIRSWMERTAPLMGELLDIDFVHYAIDPQTRAFTEDNVTMATKAARLALAMAGKSAHDVDLLCYGSAHQDQMPTASTRIQAALGILKCDEFGIHANCTSAYKALYLAHHLIASGRNDCAVVLSASTASSELRGEYYNPAHLDKESLFLRWFLSDGAGALVLTSAPGPLRVEATYVESLAGSKPSLMNNGRPALWLNPRDEYEQGLHHLKQRFRNALSSEIFQEPAIPGVREAGSVFFHGLKRMIEREAVPVDRVRRFQVNMPTRHIIDSIVDECTRMGIAREALYTPLARLGYCGPPMALIGLDSLLRSPPDGSPVGAAGRAPLQPGDRILSFVTEVSAFMQAGYCCEVMDG